MERYLEKHESMHLVAKKLRAKRPHVKDTTLIAYLNHFRMAEMANPIAHVDKVQQEIEKIYKPTTQKNACTSNQISYSNSSVATSVFDRLVIMYRVHWLIG